MLNVRSTPKGANLPGVGLHLINCSSFKLDNNTNMKSTGQGEKHCNQISVGSQIFARENNRSRYGCSLALCFFPPTQSTSVFADYFIHDGFEVTLLYS